MEINIYVLSAIGNIFPDKPRMIIDVFNSLIWTERFNGYGDFELCLPDTSPYINYIFDNFRKKFDILFEIKDSKTSMLLENIEFINDFENGNNYILSGRSLESILERRIIWNQTILSGNLKNGIKRLLNENAISPTNAYRRIDNLEFEEPTGAYINGLVGNIQFTGDNLYDAIYYICDEFDMGFEIKRKALLTGNENDNGFVFRLIRGEDRSFDQKTGNYDFAKIQKERKSKRQYRSNPLNQYVIFSYEYDNVLSSDYLYSLKNIKNIALIAGEGEGSERRKIELDPLEGASTDVAYWSRRELFVDARDISSNEGEITPSTYNNLLKERGYEKLAEYLDIDSIEGQFNLDGMFKLNRDYFLGDIVQVIFPIFNIEKKAKITEIVISEDQNGLRKYPNLELFDNQNEED